LPKALPRFSLSWSDEVAPLAAEPSVDALPEALAWVLDEVLPPAAALDDEGLPVEPETLEPGHWQLLPTDAEPAGVFTLAEVVPLERVVSIDCELVEPLLVPPAAALELGCEVEPLGCVAELPPVAALLEPEPVDCDVLAPWFIDDEVLVSVEVWLALTPLETLWSPLEPTLTPGLMLAPALMSVLLMPTLASTPTLGLTLVWAKAGPNAPITAAAVTLTAKFLSLITLLSRD